MNLDRERILFLAKAIKAAIDLNASIDGDESTPFFEQLYQEFLSLQPLPLPDVWLRERLAGAFLSMNVPPTWVEDEPAWPYSEGRPMTFISQTTIPENEVSTRHLSPGETVYLFGIRQPVGNGFRMVYRTVSQFAELSQA